VLALFPLTMVVPERGLRFSAVFSRLLKKEPAIGSVSLQGRSVRMMRVGQELWIRRFAACEIFLESFEH